MSKESFQQAVQKNNSNVKPLHAQEGTSLYLIPDHVKSNMITLLDMLAKKGIELQAIGVIHEIVTVLNNPYKQVPKAEDSEA